MVRGVVGPPGVGVSGGWGLAQPGEGVERARAEERRSVRERRRKVRGLIAVVSGARNLPW